MAALYLCICGPCLVDINEDSQEEDNTNIDQLGEYVVHSLLNKHYKKLFLVFMFHQLT